MATLAHKTILVVGGTSGIGFGVAKAALLTRAARVVVASSSAAKVAGAVQRLQAVIKEKGLPGAVAGEVADVTDLGAVRALLARVGEIDHLVWTSGDPLKLGFPDVELESVKNAFDVRFWGATAAAQVAKIRPGGSITLTIGSVVVKPRKTWSIAAAVTGAVDSVTRGLAVDLAPVRVNVISPGYVRTEMWDRMPAAQREKFLGDIAETLLVQHVADADEIAEAYMFVLKCNYITGQRIEVDGGLKFV